MIAPDSDLTVIDVASGLAGRTAARLFTELGATVIRLDRMGAGPTPPTQLAERGGLVADRNKLNAAVNLAQREGHEVLNHALTTADVLIEDWTDEERAAIGITQEEARALNPRLVHVHVAWTPPGTPLASLPPYQELLQAYAGLMADDGYGRPTAITSVPVGEPSASVMATIAAGAALYRREQTGQGAYCEVSVLQSALQQQTTGCVVAERDTDPPPTQGGRGGPRRSIGGFSPMIAADGRWVFVSGWADRQFQALARDAGFPHLADDPAYATRMMRQDHGDDLNALFFHWASEIPSATLVERMRAARVPVALIVDEIKELIDDTHARESGLIRDVDGDWQVGAGFEIDGEWPDEHPAHALGQDTRDALQRFGFSTAEIDGMLKSGVVRAAN